jgi:23S rRNA (adenine2503-C2)-methyltransferase
MSQHAADKPEILSLSVGELAEKVKELGHKPYRGRQLFAWLHARRARTFEEMTDLPREFRQQLAERFSIPRLEVASVQTDAAGTSKYLFPRLAPGGSGATFNIEAVLIRTPNRRTACLSSQVGCGQACQFCVTGQLQLRANLAPWEIEGQIVAMEEHSGERIDHVVYMGMGEPFDNWRNVSRSLDLLRHQLGHDLAARRITVSTAGVAPKIALLGKEHPNVRLAISLVAPDDYLRDVLMPINRRFPLAELMKAARSFPLNSRDRITFEYPLLKAVNDTPYHARRVAELLRGLRCKVNLIPLNESPLLPFERPDEATVLAFKEILMERGVWTTVRYSAGGEVQAACGQLVYLSLEKSAAEPGSDLMTIGASAPPAQPVMAEGHAR